MTKKNDSSQTNDQDNLIAAGREEREFVRETLATELGREPTEDELSEWLREHTESY